MAVPAKANINGLSCRLPKSDNVTEFWENLINGIDMIGPTRWPVGLAGLPPRAGHIKSINRFDYEYFGLTEYECEMRNPMLNLLLEVTYEAVLDSGLDWASLHNSSTGYFLGCTMSDVDFVMTSQSEPLLDNTRSYLVHNIMKTFNLNGPALSVDTACSSSISALQLAVTEMMSGRCQYAFVAGANLILNPNMSLQFHKLQMLSPTGTSRAFDISANGYVRADGIVVMLISRSDISCPRIYSSIVDVATNCDGFKEEAVIFPSKADQSCLLRDIYKKNNIDVQELYYVEAHGTGTQKGDFVEVTALSDVLCNRRESPLLIGSVKSNMGHCESTAGLAGLLKCVLSMHYGVIPANLNYKTTNPTILPIVEGKIKVVDKPTDIKDHLIGLNSFGFGGANGHVILKPYNESKQDKNTVPDYCLLPIKARSLNSFSTLQKFVYNNVNSPDVLSLINHSLLSKDKMQYYRGYCLFNVNNPDEFDSNCMAKKKRSGLWIMLEDVSVSLVCGAKNMFQISSFQESVKKSAKGQLSVLCEIGQLMSEDVPLHCSIEAIDLPSVNLQLNSDVYPNQKILKELTDGKYEFENTVEDIKTSKLALVRAFTLLIGMVDVLKASNIEIEGFVGCGLSEIVLAYQDGCFSRRTCLQIGLKLEEFFRDTCETCSDKNDIQTCFVSLPSSSNVYQIGPQITVHQMLPGNNFLISIPRHCLEKVLQIIHRKGGFFSNVEYPVVLYSHIMEKYEQRIVHDLKPLIGHPKYLSSGAITYSKVHGTSEPKQFSSEYFARLLCRTISVPKLTELIPSGRSLLQLCVNQTSTLQMSVSLENENLIHSYCDLRSFLHSLGVLHMTGHDVDVGYLHSNQFPVNCKAPPLSPLAGWDHSKELPMVEWTSYSASVKQDINWSYTVERFGEDVSFKLDPISCFIYHVWKAISGRMHKGNELPRVILKNIEYCETLLMEDLKKSVIHVLPAKKTFTVSNNDCVVFSGKYELSPEDDVIPRIPGYDVDINENIFTFENDIDIEKTEIMWEDNWLYFLNELVEFAGQYFSRPLLKVYLDPVGHMREVKRCAKILAVAEMYTGLCKAGSVLLQFQNMGFKPKESIVEDTAIGNESRIKKFYLYKFNSKTINSGDRLLVYVGENKGKNILGLSLLSESTKQSGEIEISREWSDEDVETFIPVVIASHLLETSAPFRGKTLMVVPPIDSVGIFLLAMATKNGCKVFSSSWDSETSSLLEEIFQEANIVSGYQIYNAVMEKTDGRGCDVCFKLAGGDVNPTLALVANDGKVIQSGLLSGEEPPVDSSVFLRNIDLYIGDTLDAFDSFLNKDREEKDSIVKQMDDDCISELKEFGYPETQGLLYEVQHKTIFKQPIAASNLFQFLDDPSWKLEKSDLGVTEEEWNVLLKLQESMNLKSKEYSFFQEADDLDSAHANRGMLVTPSAPTHVFNLVNFKIDSAKSISQIRHSTGSRKTSYVATPWFKNSPVASTPQILVTEVFDETSVRKPLLSFSGCSPAQKVRFGSRLTPSFNSSQRLRPRQSGSSIGNTPFKQVDLLYVGNRSVFTPSKSIFADSDLIKPLNKVKSAEKPLFLVHPITGSVGPLKHLANELNIPCYGIERTSSTPSNSLQNVARNALEMSYPSNSYRLCGYSLGAIIALEMALQLQSASKQVECLIFIEGSPEYSKGLVQFALNNAPPGLNQAEADEYLEISSLLAFMTMFPGFKDENLVQMALQSLSDMESRIELAVNITLGNIILNSNQKKTKWFLAKDLVMAKSPAVKQKSQVGVFNTAQEVIKIARKQKAENFVVHTKMLRDYVAPLVKYHGDINLLRVKKDPEHSLPVSTDYGTPNLCDGKTNLHFFNGTHDTVIIAEHKKVAEVINKIIST